MNLRQRLMSIFVRDGERERRTEEVALLVEQSAAVEERAARALAERARVIAATRGAVKALRKQVR